MVTREGISSAPKGFARPGFADWGTGTLVVNMCFTQGDNSLSRFVEQRTCTVRPVDMLWSVVPDKIQKVNIGFYILPITPCWAGSHLPGTSQR